MADERPVISNEELENLQLASKAWDSIAMSLGSLAMGNIEIEKLVKSITIIEDSITTTINKVLELKTPDKLLKSISKIETSIAGISNNLLNLQKPVSIKVMLVDNISSNIGKVLSEIQQIPDSKSIRLDIVDDISKNIQGINQQLESIRNDKIVTVNLTDTNNQILAITDVITKLPHSIEIIVNAIDKVTPVLLDIETALNLLPNEKNITANINDNITSQIPTISAGLQENLNIASTLDASKLDSSINLLIGTIGNLQNSINQISASSKDAGIAVDTEFSGMSQKLRSYSDQLKTAIKKIGTQSLTNEFNDSRKALADVAKDFMNMFKKGTSTIASTQSVFKRFKEDYLVDMMKDVSQLGNQFSILKEQTDDIGYDKAFDIHLKSSSDSIKKLTADAKDFSIEIMGGIKNLDSLGNTLINIVKSKESLTEEINKDSEKLVNLALKLKEATEVNDAARINSLEKQINATNRNVQAGKELIYGLDIQYTAIKKNHDLQKSGLNEIISFQQEHSRELLENEMQNQMFLKQRIDLYSNIETLLYSNNNLSSTERAGLEKKLLLLKSANVISVDDVNNIKEQNRELAIQLKKRELLGNIKDYMYGEEFINSLELTKNSADGAYASLKKLMDEVAAGTTDVKVLQLEFEKQKKTAKDIAALTAITGEFNKKLTNQTTVIQRLIALKEKLKTGDISLIEKTELENLARAGGYLKNLGDNIDKLQSEHVVLANIGGMSKTFKKTKADILATSEMITLATEAMSKLGEKADQTSADISNQQQKIMQLTNEIANLSGVAKISKEAELAVLQDELSLNQKLLDETKKLYDETSNRAGESTEKLLILDKKTADYEKTLSTLRQQIQQTGIDPLFGNILQGFKNLTSQVATFIDKPKIAFTLLGAALKKNFFNPVWDGFMKIGGGAADLSKLFTTSVGAMMSFEAIGMGVGMKDASEAAAALTQSLGTTGDINKDLVRETAILQSRYGVSAQEGAALARSLKPLVGGSNIAAANTMKMARNMATAEGVPIGEMMHDVAASTEDFALFGKQGGKNIFEASIFARKLGVTMKEIGAIARGLLDVENSLQAEMEAQVMTGRSMNLNKARELALSNDLEGATNEMLKQVGGINEFNKMNYYQRQSIAKMAGIEASQLQQMLSQREEEARILRDNGNWLGTAIIKMQMVGKSVMENKDSLMMLVIAAGSLGNALKTAGAFAQLIGGGFKSALMWSGRLVASIWQAVFGERGMLAAIRASTAAREVGAGVSMAAGKVGGFLGKATGVTKVRRLMAARKLASTAGGAAPITKTTDALDKSRRVGSKIPSKAGSGVRVFLTNLAGGLKAMGNVKVLFGALNLIPASIGLVALLPAIPSMAVISALGKFVGIGLKGLANGLGIKGMAQPGVTMGAINLLAAAGALLVATAGIPGMIVISAFGWLTGQGLIGLAAGLTAMAGTLPGSLALLAAGGALLVATLGIPGMIAISAFGWLAGQGLIGLSTGLTALGTAAASGAPLTGIGLIALFGLALIPLTYALSKLAPLIEPIGKAIGTVIESIGTAISTIVQSIGNLITTLSAIPLSNLIGLSIGFMAIAGSLTVLAASLSISIIPLTLGSIALGIFSGALVLAGMGLQMVMPQLTNLGNFFSTFDTSKLAAFGAGMLQMSMSLLLAAPAIIGASFAMLASVIPLAIVGNRMIKVAEALERIGKSVNNIQLLQQSLISIAGISSGIKELAASLSMLSMGITDVAKSSWKAALSPMMLIMGTLKAVSGAAPSTLTSNAVTSTPTATAVTPTAPAAAMPTTTVTKAAEPIKQPTPPVLPNTEEQKQQVNMKNVEDLLGKLISIMNGGFKLDVNSGELALFMQKKAAIAKSNSSVH